MGISAGMRIFHLCSTQSLILQEVTTDLRKLMQGQRPASEDKPYALPSLLVLWLLIVYWPKQVTLPSADSRTEILTPLSLQQKLQGALKMGKHSDGKNLQSFFAIYIVKCRKSLLHMVYGEISLNHSLLLILQTKYTLT